MVHQLADKNIQVTALNFSGKTLQATVRSEYLPPGASVTDMSSGQKVGIVDSKHNFELRLERYEGLSLLVTV